MDKIIEYVFQNEEMKKKAAVMGIHSIFSIANCSCPGDYGDELKCYEKCGRDFNGIDPDGYDCFKCWTQEVEGGK